MRKKASQHLIISSFVAVSLLLFCGCFFQKDSNPSEPVTSISDQYLVSTNKRFDKGVMKNAEYVHVLLYHIVIPEKEVSSNAAGMIVPLEEFQEQMAWLKKNGYTTTTLSQFAAWLHGEGELPEKSVLITFDDGYSSISQYVWPVLEENQFTCTVFIIGAFTDASDTGSEYLSWEQILAMDEAKVAEFQSHTYDGHGGITSNPNILSWSREEIAEDFALLEEAFKSNGLDKPWAFAYPFGAINDHLLEVLAERQYSLAFTTKHGFVKPGDDPLTLKRIIIWPDTTIEQFEHKLKGE